jgi:hypothetical protein
MSENNKAGLSFEVHESQRDDGSINLTMQKEKQLEATRYWSSNYTNSIRVRQVETDNVQASMNAYIGINNKQWPDQAVTELLAQGRPVNTFNMIKPNIDKVYGQIINNPNNITFTPINNQNISPINIVQSLYDYDYERGAWEKEMHRFIKDALIHTGVLEMFKDYTHSKIGNVGVRSLNRFLDIVFDPYWNSDNIADCNYAFKSEWMTSRELKDNYRTKSAEIDNAIASFESRDGIQTYSEDVEVLQERNTEFYDQQRDRYRVIEVVYMQKIPRERMYSKKLKRLLKENELPDVKRVSDITIADNEDYVKLIDYEMVCKVMTMAPAVQHGLILQEGDHPVQVGKLPFYVASSDNTMGERQGLVTGMIDAQTTLNKRQSMITGRQITETNGGIIVKESFFKDKAEHKKFVKKRNVPGMVFTADDNAKLSDGILPIPTGNSPENLETTVSWTEEFMEKYTNSNAAVSGRSEGANESGALFEAKRTQSQIAHVGIMENIAQIQKQIAEDYFYFHKKVYAGKYRSFTNAKTGKQFEINKSVNVGEMDAENAAFNQYLASADANGRVTINDIANLPRHDVVIKRSELGLDQKQRSLSVFAEMSQRTKNPVLQSVYEKAMLPLIDMPEAFIPVAEDAADIFIEFQLAQMKNNTKLLMDGMIQSDVNTKTLVAQSGQPRQGAVEPAKDARQVGNTPGNGNLPESVASDSSGANNQTASDT